MIKDANNPFFKSKYLELSDLLENLEPLAIEVGLIISQGNAHRHGDEYVISRLTHAASGQFVESEYKIGFNANPQQNAASSTYARRYSLKGLVGLAEIDDDGNTASGKSSKTSKPVASKPASNSNSTSSKPVASGFGGASKPSETQAPSKTPARVGSFGG